MIVILQSFIGYIHCTVSYQHIHLVALATGSTRVLRRELGPRLCTKQVTQQTYMGDGMCIGGRQMSDIKERNVDSVHDTLTAGLSQDELHSDDLLKRRNSRPHMSTSMDNDCHSCQIVHSRNRQWQ